MNCVIVDLHNSLHDACTDGRENFARDDDNDRCVREAAFQQTREEIDGRDDGRGRRLDLVSSQGTQERETRRDERED